MNYPLLVISALVLACCSPTAVAGDATAPSGNTAIIPLPKIEDDCYDWNARHAAVLKAKVGAEPEIVLIGDSITHFWAGEPAGPRVNGPHAWMAAFGERKVLNLGFGWDRTQNVLWRLDHGEFEGLKPLFVVLNIGTNNFSGTGRARENTPAEVAEGIAAITAKIHTQSPTSRLIVMAVFPRGQRANDPFRAKISELNRLLAAAVKPPDAFIDIGAKMLLPDGTMDKEMMGDFVHPTEKGYAVWAEALREQFAAK